MDLKSRLHNRHQKTNQSTPSEPEFYNPQQWTWHPTVTKFKNSPAGPRRMKPWTWPNPRSTRRQTSANRKPNLQTQKRIKRSLLLEPISYNEALTSTSFHTSQSENEVKDPRPITTDAMNMQSEVLAGAVNDTPPQDEPQSYPMAQIAQ